MNTQAQDLFIQARELEPAQREAFLAQACGDNAELHLEVQRLLVEAERADSFFGDDDGGTLGAQEFQETYAEKEGDQIGPYKLRQPHGEGGFGTVWMAEQSVPISRMVAFLESDQGRDGHQAGAGPLRGRAPGAGDDGPPAHRQGAGCRSDSDRPTVVCHGTGERRADHRLL
jgi:hypothetical protein